MAGDRDSIHGVARGDVPHVRADVAQIQQVLINLVVNACEAMPAERAADDQHVPPPGGRPEEPAAHGGARPGCCPPHRDRHGHWHRLGDAGTHLRAVLHHQAFGQGSGPGLSTVAGIVKQSGGDIVVDSSEQGTSFTVLLPAAEQDVR
jgi:signal transduction histidine kinase